MEFSIPHIRAILRQTPGTVRSMLSELPEPLPNSNYGPGTWSPFDIVGHYIHGEKTDWIPRARHILEHGQEPPFVPFDRYAQLETSAGKTIHDLLDEFDAERSRTLSDLDSLDLSPADLARAGTHPEFGRVTLQQLIATWPVHDLHHMAQISKAIAYQLKGDIGPWRRYIGIVGQPE